LFVHDNVVSIATFVIHIGVSECKVKKQNRKCRHPPLASEVDKNTAIPIRFWFSTSGLNGYVLQRFVVCDVRSWRTYKLQPSLSI
jgi:hypothetical protein